MTLLDFRDNERDAIARATVRAILNALRDHGLADDYHMRLDESDQVVYQYGREEVTFEEFCLAMAREKELILSVLDRATHMAKSRAPATRTVGDE